ncbi:hypothetical protein [Streptomyces sp. cmx-18-6]|uniref:hypothetical protein n=1 Tax=Streptomyces sp. cmx-18-6 TaxID=2790930 RepID=UPI003980BA75
MHLPDSNTAPLGESGDLTEAAFITITTTSNGPSITASVPGTEADRMMTMGEFVVGVGGTAVGPYVMAKALEVAAVEVPWPALTIVLVLAALLPMGGLWLTIRLRG